MTKEEAIYGVFYEDDESNKADSMDIDDEKYYKNRIKYATPIGFVSSGVYELNPDKEKQKLKDEENSSTSTTSTTTTTTSSKKKKSSDSSSKDKKKKSNSNKNGSGGTDGATTQAYKGIGSLLLQKMGYQGGGLGADGKGLVEPIQVHNRGKGTAGLSYINENIDKRSDYLVDKDDEAPTSSSGEEEDEEESGGDEGVKGKGWKKKEKVEYDLDEHITGGIKNKRSIKDRKIAPQLIVDMRGPQAKILTDINDSRGNVEEEGTAASSRNKQGPLFELKHNIGLLVKLKEIDIQNNENKLKIEREKVNHLKSGVQRLTLTLKNDESNMKKIEDIKEIVNSAKEKLERGELELRSVHQIFRLLQTKYTKEYQNFKLYKLDQDLVQPLLRKELSEWVIEDNPSHLADEMLEWKQLFESSISVLGQGSDTYFLIVRDLVMPVFKNYFRTKWNVKKPKVAVTLIGFWCEALPTVVLENLMEQSVLPRIKMEIENWDPRTDPIPIHSWVQPWIPFLKSELETFYPSIRQKLISVLNDWHPSDLSAHEILLPWKGVFEGNSMDSLLNRSIVPKLKQELISFEINPSQQSNIDPVRYLFGWMDLISMKTIVGLYEKEFFPKWHTVLIKWLNQADSDFEEISNWYKGWKQQFPSEIANNDRIKVQFSLALGFMKKAMSGEPIPSVNDSNPLTYQTIESLVSSLHNKPPPPPPQQHQHSQSSSNDSDASSRNNSNNIKGGSSAFFNNNNEISTKQMIEELAIQNNLLFIPSQRKTDSGQQIYMFSTIPIIFDRGLIMLFENLKWIPADIQTLLEKSKNKNL
eukprot:gene7643-9401_t